MASPARQFFDIGDDPDAVRRPPSLRLLRRPVPVPAAPRSLAHDRDPRTLARQLAQVIAEVLVGARPARQLDDLTAPEVIRLLCRNAGRLAARPGLIPVRPIVDSVHLRQPRADVAEACAVVDLGVRKRAIAIRLESTDGRWRCTALHIG
jgi:hypothetical protein